LVDIGNYAGDSGKIIAISAEPVVSDIDLLAYRPASRGDSMR
jgi:hypothetical protein